MVRGGVLRVPRSGVDIQCRSPRAARRARGCRRGGDTMVMQFDIVIIGAGIAGLSAASELARLRRHRAQACPPGGEDDVAQHTSARSAQQLIPSYGPGSGAGADPGRPCPAVGGLRDLPTPLVWPSPFVVAGSAEDVEAERCRAWPCPPTPSCSRAVPELGADPVRYRTAAVDDSAVRSERLGQLLAWHRRRAEEAGVGVRTGLRVAGAGGPVRSGSCRVAGRRRTDPATRSARPPS
ncbi:hypothetical protein QJS66_07310 [Kocuria rhizophila]|nr:hypothetical protein QJS66_07310 [Kocuria rhizophila]